MVASRSLVLSAVAVAAVVCAPLGADAHGYLMVPPAKLASSGDPTKYAATIYGPSALTAPAGMKFSDTIQNNLAAFTKAYKSAGWSSLASFIKKKAPSAGACGTTSLTPSSPKTVGDYVQWSSFAESHVGPCEVWCGSTRVFQNDNCAGAYKTTPAKLPISKAKCASAKQLTFYWLALHEINWQVYINCVSLKGSETRSIEDDEGAGEEDEEESGDEARANDADCDEELPEPDCDDDLPEPSSDGDCDQDLPEPDCDDELPEPSDTAAGDADAPTTPGPTSKTPSSPTKPAPATKSPSTPPTPTPGADSPSSPSSGSKPTTPSGEVGGDADCDDDLPEPADDDDCGDDLPEPSGSDDCEKDLPEPTETPTVATVTPSAAAGNVSETGAEGDSYGFDALQRGTKYSPGKAATEDY